jgi:hypothetical protein
LAAKRSGSVPVIRRIADDYFSASGLMELAPKSRTRIDLISFANVASFAYIQANLADDANGSAVITLGNGETITITGVAFAALSRIRRAPQVLDICWL